MKRLINIIRSVVVALLFSVLLFAAWLVNTESGLHWLVDQTHAYLPGQLELENVRGQLSGPVEIARLHYQQDNAARVEIEQLRIDWSLGALLVGQLRFNEVSAQRLHIQLAEDENINKSAATNLPRIAIPINIAVSALNVNDIEIQRAEGDSINIEHLGLAASMHWDKLKLDRLDVTAFNTQLKLRGAAELSGDYAHNLSFNWNAEESPLGSASGQGSLNGDLKQTSLKHKLNRPLQANADFTLLDLLQKPGWQGHIKTEKFALQTLRPNLPQATVAIESHIQGDLQQQHLQGSFSSSSEVLAEVNGSFSLSTTPQLLKLDSLQLQSPDGSRQARLHGEWQPSTNLTELALVWHGIGWPMQNQAQVNSAHGSAYIKGTPANYHFSMAADLAGRRWHDSHLRAIGSGDLKGVNISKARLFTLDGVISGPVQLAWADGFGWKTTLSARAIDPARQFPDWPGNINFKLTSEGNSRKGLSAKLTINKFNGTLRELPVQLKGNLVWQDETLSLHNVEFHSADSVAKADGDIGQQLNLNWQIESRQLSQLHPDLGGSVTASGSLRGERAAPLLQLKLSGDSLAWRKYAIGKITANGTADLFQWQQLTLNAHAEQLNLNDQNLEAIDVDLSSRQLKLAVKHASAALDLQADGAWRDQAWRGKLTRFRIDGDAFGAWQQRRPVNLTLAPDQLMLERLCLDSDNAYLCAQIDHNTPQVWNANIESRNLPLALLTPFLENRLELDGTADISLQAALNKDQLRGNGNIQLHPGSVRVRMPDNELEHWDYRQGSINITLNQAALKTEGQLQINAQDSFSLNAELPRFNPFEFDPNEQRLIASAKLELAQLDILQGLVYEARNIQGRLTLQADAKGALATPSVNGKLSLQNGAMDLPRLGLHLKNINADATGTQNKVDYRVSAESGDGYLKAEATTQLQPGQGWPTQIKIDGDNFQLANIPEARIDVSPQLQINIKHRRIDADGTVEIPYAKLQPKDITSAKMPSDDVRIEGAPPPAEGKWQIYSNIRLILSERIFLTGFGFDGRITGNVLLSTAPGKPPIGVGELSVVEGRYSAYGQRLDIDRGRLLFASSPLNNPGLDLRAVRRIQEVTAGVAVTGTLRNPKFEVFSTPAMGQTDALSYLVLGRPLEEGAGSDGSVVAAAALALGLKGGDFLARKIGDRFGLDEVRVETSQTGEEASLLMGRYLSPRLYISYGVGLIEAVNTLKLRYEISSKWQLTAESGEEQGADLLYTIERGD